LEAAVLGSAKAIFDPPKVVEQRHEAELQRLRIVIAKITAEDIDKKRALVQGALSGWTCISAQRVSTGDRPAAEKSGR